MFLFKSTIFCGTNEVAGQALNLTGGSVGSAVAHLRNPEISVKVPVKDVNNFLDVIGMCLK